MEDVWTVPAQVDLNITKGELLKDFELRQQSIANKPKEIIWLCAGGFKHSNLNKNDIEPRSTISDHKSIYLPN